MDSEVRAVNIAIASNILIFTAKCFVSAHSGSSALLAEAVHSLADIGNQLLLRLGIAKSMKQPTAEFPYGYLKDKFVFSLISAVGVFCIGAGASMINGVNALADVDHDVGNFNLGFTVLAVSFLVEGFSCYVAVRTVANGASRLGVTFFDYLDSGNDPAAVAVMAEDGAAVVGIIIAAASTLLVKLTDWQAWDGIGSILVGILLACVALFLIQRNRSALIGRSMSADDFNRVVNFLNADPVVNKVYDAKSEEIGAGVYRFTAELDFDGRVIAERHLRTIDSSALFRKFQNTRNVRNPADERAFTIVLAEYGALLVQAVGAEVDRIESEIRSLVPGVQYVDLEADRGRFSLYKSSMDEGDYAGRGWFDMSRLSMDEVPWLNEIDRVLFDGAGAGAGGAEEQAVDASEHVAGAPEPAAGSQEQAVPLAETVDSPKTGIFVVQRELNKVTDLKPLVDGAAADASDSAGVGGAADERQGNAAASHEADVAGRAAASEADTASDDCGDVAARESGSASSAVVEEPASDTDLQSNTDRRLVGKDEGDVELVGQQAQAGWGRERCSGPGKRS